jgi:mono/diheme cytochrome c family protein
LAWIGYWAMALGVLTTLASPATSYSGDKAANGAMHSAGPKISGADRAAAAEIFDTRCSACHGSDGRGDGPGAAALKPKPANFRNRDWQKSVSDHEIAKAIVYGGGAVGRSNQMAANPDLEDQPAVVKALVAHVREFGK